MKTKTANPMKTKTATLFAALALGLGLGATEMQAQLVTIDTVYVGNANNPASNTTNAASWGSSFFQGYGAVGYNYRIGKNEVTISQYTAFLNAVATIPLGLYQTDLWSSEMSSDLNVAGINRSGSGTVATPYSYSVVVGSGNRPISNVSWFDAARFTNWLHNGATVAASTETGAYNLNGATSGIITKGAGAEWWIPSEDEWVKAAYYNPDTLAYSLYANKSDSMTTNAIGSSGGANHRDVPNFDYATTQSNIYSSSQNYLTNVGAYATESFYGTFDQSGNVAEWNDAVLPFVRGGIRGGSWSEGLGGLSAQIRDRGISFFEPERNDIGFRVASVPEPSAAVLMLLGAVYGLMRRRKATL